MTLADWPILLSATVLGLAGSGHCLAMCGGIAGAAGGQFAATGSPRRTLAGIAAFNGGRLLSYLCIGMVAAGLSGSLLSVVDPAMAARFSRGAIAVVLALSGLKLLTGRDYLGLAQVGALFWRKLHPLTRRLQLLPAPIKWPLLGIAWGLLPCGLVYSAAALALASGDPLQGAVLMSAFGLGTLPSMMGAGAASAFLLQLASGRGARQAGGVLLLLMAAWMAATMSGLLPMTALSPGHHH